MSRLVLYSPIFQNSKPIITKTTITTYLAKGILAGAEGAAAGFAGRMSAGEKALYWPAVRIPILGIVSAGATRLSAPSWSLIMWKMLSSPPVDMQ